MDGLVCAWVPDLALCTEVGKRTGRVGKRQGTHGNEMRRNPLPDVIFRLFIELRLCNLDPFVNRRRALVSIDPKSHKLPQHAQQ